MKAIDFIKLVATKSLTGNRGSGIRTIPSAMAAEAKAGEFLALLQKAGIPINQLDDYIRSEADVLKFINIIENANKPRVIPGTSAEGKAITEKLFGKKGEVVEFPQKRSFKEEIDSMKKSGDLVDEKDMVISDKIKNREMFKNSNLNKPTIEGQMEKITGASNRIKEIQKEIDAMYKPKVDTVEETVTYIKTLEPMTAMKEANLVIGRKGKYKNLSPEESKKILQDTEDHIFERDIPDEDFAKGGRAGYGLGSLIKPANANQNQNMSGVDPRMNLDYDTLVEQNVDKRLQDPTFLNNIKGVKAPDFTKMPVEPNPDIPVEELIDGPYYTGKDYGPGNQPYTAVMPQEGMRYVYDEQGTRYSIPNTQPTSLEDYLSGYEQYKSKNPNKYMGAQALVPAMLPGGFEYTFSSSPHASHFNDYLRSIGLSPYEKYADESMIEKFNQGGRAGFYTGGITDIEPDLSDIGHGSDSLMARTRLVSPDGQATTSTGLNYLLAEDNDNIRVPFKGGGLTPEDYLKVKDMLDHWHRYKKSGKPKISKPDFAAAFFRENNAEGGRIGFSAGGGGRRAFLKLLATLGGGIAGLKSGLFGIGGKEATKKSVTEAVKQSAGSGTPPPYFFKLVEKIKTMGDDTLPSQDKVIAKKYKDYTMEEDFAGNIEIIKKNKNISEDVYMSYKVDEVPTKIGKKKSSKVEEYEEFTATPDAEGKMKNIEQGVPDEVVQEGTMFEDNMTEFGKADGGRIGFRVGGSGKKFIEKIFGKGSLDVMKSRDPELHKGMLEVVEMFRNRDKEGLKMYLQKFLPHMDDETIEAFIVGDAVDAAGQGKYGLDNIQGQLIRLGSGRDYAGKIEMMKKADNMRALDKLDVDKMKPNANGGLITMLGE